MISAAAAFSGPWAVNLRGWLWVVAPTSGVVVAQELATPGLTPGFIAASALLQLVGVTIWSIAVTGLSRLRTGRVVPAASALMWIGSGLVHALVGGTVANAAGVAPEWGYRVAFWVLASIAWMPLLTYGLAKWDEHRALLAERAELSTELDDALARATEDADAQQSRLAAAVGSALEPALLEIRAQVSDARTGMDPATAQQISARLDELARQAAAFADASPIDFPARSRSRVSLSQASVDFELRRPLLAAVLSAALVGIPLVAEGYRGGGWAGLGAMIGGLAASTTVLAGAFLALRSRHLAASRRSLLSRVAVVAAAVAAAGVLLALTGIPAPAHTLALAAVLATVQVIATSLVVTVVALRDTNREVGARITADRAALAQLHARALATETAAAARLRIVLRGNVNGLLAGCAMTLAFLANDDIAADGRDVLVARVLDHLDAAVDELRAA